MLPNFLIIGAPKAATTWIADALREHPEAYVPKLKELRFFCGANYASGRKWYERRFRDAANETVIGEASPSYLGSAEAPRRIHAAVPEAKLIMSVRHPVDQAYSFYWHQLTRGLCPPDTQFTAYFDQDRPRAGFYGSHLNRYLEYFAREQILILLYEEDILGNPRQGLRKCCEFLGIQTDFTPAVLQSKSNPRRDMTRFHGAERLARGCLSVLPRQLTQPLKRQGKKVLKRLPKQSGRAELDPALRWRLLRAHYLDDIRSLERLSRKDFSAWYAA